MLYHVGDFMNHSVDKSTNTRRVLSGIVPITAFAAELIVRVACFLRLVLSTVLTGILGNVVLIILSTLHLTVIPRVITEPGRYGFRR